MITTSESGKGGARKVVLADCPTPLADERPVPLSVVLTVNQMIVTPKEDYKKNERDRGEDCVEFQGQR